MIPSISHNREDESIKAKAKWFQDLSLEERMELLCFYTDLILQNNPQMGQKKYAQSITGRIQILSKTKR